MVKNTKQQIAQKRNYFKFVLAGMKKPIDISVLTLEEQCFYNNLLEYRQKLISNFDKGSLEMGLKVNNKKHINE